MPLEPAFLAYTSVIKNQKRKVSSESESKSCIKKNQKFIQTTLEAYWSFRPRTFRRTNQKFIQTTLDAFIQRAPDKL